MSRHGADTEPSETICIQPCASPAQDAPQRALTFRGTLVIYGSLSLGSFAIGAEEVGPFVFKNVSIRGFALPTLLDAQGLRRELSSLFDRVAQCKLRVVHGGRYLLGEAAEAHRALEARETIGKLVLKP